MEHNKYDFTKEVLGGDPNCPGLTFPKPEPPKNEIRRSSNTPENPNPHVQFILKAQSVRNLGEPNVNRLWEIIKWIWGFSPMLWLAILSIIIPAIVSITYGYAITIQLLWFSAGIWLLWAACYAIYDTIGRGTIGHCKKWWSRRPWVLLKR
jgi:hypothetical protein